MILDFHDIKFHRVGNRWYHTTDFRIIDDTTGAELTREPIFYADDEAGFYRHYKTDPCLDGWNYFTDDDGNLVVCEVHRKIRLVPRPGTGARIRRPPADHAVA